VTSFVGRGADLERTIELLAGSRVVTLLGPAGIGKTRLATAVADAVKEKFQGVWFVHAAEARSESALVAGVATALGDSTGDVGHALAGRGDVLVVIDNTEQVTDAAAKLLASWTSTAPRARFLVSSRERLRIESEACLELLPLGEGDAAKLFVDRAALARGRFSPNEAESKAIAELVRRLDGNPLAIELAAARTKLFSVEDLLARIGKRFELLTGGPRDRTARQGSLRGAIDWSWELLSDDEKKALARCSVFRGGFSADAAIAVIGRVELLESLVDKSLVRHDDRFALSETIRDYAAEKLAEMPAERDDATKKHVAFYAAFADARAAELRGEKALAAVAGLRAEADNVLEAQRRLRGTDRAAAAAIALALNVLIAMRGPVELQRELLDAAVSDAEASGDAPLRVRAFVARARARLIRGDTQGAEADADAALAASENGTEASRALALETRARVDLERGRSDRARTEVDEACALYQKLGDRNREASALAFSASVHIKQGHIEVSRPILERALAMQRELGDRVAMMSLLGNLGIVHHWQDRDDEAKRCYRAALDIAIEIGDRREEAVDRINIALLLMDEGALDEARAEFETALQIQRAAGHRQYVGNVLGSLASVEMLEGNTAGARRRFEEVLSIFRELGHRRYECATHRYMGTLELEEGDLPRALECLQTAKKIGEEVGDFTSFVLGPLGAVLALMGRTKEAEEAFGKARASLEERGEPRAFVLLEIFETFQLVARGDLEGARAVLSRLDQKHLASDARTARRLLATAIARSTGKHTELVIGEEARWFQIGSGEKVDLSKRRAPRLILLALLAERGKNRGLQLDDIIAAGWPGERIQPEAAAARAYTAIKTLRELGLGDLLVRRDDGYLLRE
jgi:predicted ATPase